MRKTDERNISCASILPSTNIDANDILIGRYWVPRVLSIDCHKRYDDRSLARCAFLRKHLHEIPTRSANVSPSDAGHARHVGGLCPTEAAMTAAAGFHRQAPHS